MTAFIFFQPEFSPQVGCNLALSLFLMFFREGDNAHAVTDLCVFLLQHASVDVLEGGNTQAVSDL